MTAAGAIPGQFQVEGFRFVKLGTSDGALKRPIERDWSTTANYPHDDPAIIQHIRRGGGYGIINGTGPNGVGLVTLDADNLPRLAEWVDIASIPSTMEAGRRGEDGEPIPERRHLHFLSALEGKHLLRDPETGEDLGDLRGSGGYQIVGPGSLHPSGARVEILEDRPLAEIPGEELLRILSPVLEEKANTDRAKLEGLTKKRPPTTTGKDPFADVSILDVIDVSGFNESGDQYFGAHPIHGSDTNHNLVVNPAKNSWWCGRHHTGGGPALWLSVEAGIIDCSDATAGALRGEKFIRTLDYARGLGLISDSKTSAVERKDDEKGGPGPSVATKLVNYALDSGATFWKSPEGDTFATIPHKAGYSENHSLGSKAVKTWLAGLIYEEEGRTAKGSAVADALAVLEGIAIHEGETHPVYVRLAEYDGKFYLDLGGEDWKAVEIGADGWRVISSDEVPVKFRRAKGMLELPEPDRDGDLEDLRRILNLPEGASWMLIQAWLVQAFKPTGPYPVLIVDGEQGSGKSWLGRILRHLIDPNKSPLRRPPRNDHDLMIAASNSWAVVYDNLSGLPKWLGDALCVVSTGGGLSTRELYTDSEEALFDIQRPIILNGIDDLTTRDDLLGRAIVLHLPRIETGKRKTEREIKAELDRIRPGVMGAVLDVVSAGIRDLPGVRLDSMPRMADFAEWIAACEGALGWEPGAFLQAFEANQDAAEAALIDGDHFAIMLIDYIDNVVGSFDGQPSALLTLLNDRHGYTARNRPEGWPGSPQALGSKLTRLAPALRSMGIRVERKTGHAKKTILRIWRDEEGALPSKTALSPPSPPLSPPSKTIPEAGEEGCGGDGGDLFPNFTLEGKNEDMERIEEKGRGYKVGKSSPPCPPSPPNLTTGSGSQWRGQIKNGGDGGESGGDGHVSIADQLIKADKIEAEKTAKFETPGTEKRDTVFGIPLRWFVDAAAKNGGLKRSYILAIRGWKTDKLEIAIHNLKTLHGWTEDEEGRLLPPSAEVVA
ncbi:bifunctional DNA primase/polymerase [Candidatus Methanocrinis natronophilus]|uniref:Bifunctional DNA primase/polymerase n=1 Tax=Candidatus Methanocrinis natronophilus TaxID=3033396 RepID=A0ABT5XAN1_9EURY|nr:bifunctional DNA primase/polymerase [Candidatus Methanocrinis natronophilus]MDF0591730.1 bifunctional DNA primase/polymerase [Candidatus Methanocrinis natronophilus]